MIPLVVGGIALASAVYGLVRGGKAISDFSDADTLNTSARDLIDTARPRLESQRVRTNAVIEDFGARKLRAFNGVIAEFLDTFGQLKNVELDGACELDELNIGQMPSQALHGLREEYELLKNSGLGLGAGLGSGAVLAFGAYNGTMLLASASTGTVISTLSGAAATNATLAWLGGGSLAAGGFGVAGGTIILGSVVAGPAIAVFGLVVGNKAEAELNAARSNMETARSFYEEVRLAADRLAAIQEVTTLANATFSRISSRLRRSIHALQTVIEQKGVDYQTFGDGDRATVLQSVKYAQLIKAMIDSPILDEKGQLVVSTGKRVRELGEMLDGGHASA